MKQQANMLKDVNSLENSCDGVHLITVAGMKAYSLQKCDFTADAFLWNLWSFTKHYF